MSGEHPTAATNRPVDPGSDTSADPRRGRARAARGTVEQEQSPARGPHATGLAAKRDLVTLDPAVCGFPGVQLGGHVAAALLGDQDGTVTFHAPVKPHAEVKFIDGGLIDADGRMLVSGRPGASGIMARDPVSIGDACAADRTMVDRQPVPTCFACGPVAAGRGLGIRPGAIPDLGVAADLWVPPLGEADQDGILPIGSVWSALDCAGFWSLTVRPPAHTNLVTGLLNAAHVRKVRSGHEHVLTAWPYDLDGHLRVTAVLHDSAGRLCAVLSQQLLAAPWGFPRSAVTDSPPPR